MGHDLHLLFINHNRQARQGILLIEKIRDEKQHLNIFNTAARYCLNYEDFYEIYKAYNDSRSAYLVTFAKNTQQVMHYQMYGLANNYIS